MNLQALTERAANGEVRELEQLSLEGDFYLARVRLDQGQLTLLDELLLMFTVKPSVRRGSF